MTSPTLQPACGQRCLCLSCLAGDARRCALQPWLSGGPNGATGARLLAAAAVTLVVGVVGGAALSSAVQQQGPTSKPGPGPGRPRVRQRLPG